MSVVYVQPTHTQRPARLLLWKRGALLLTPQKWAKLPNHPCTYLRNGSSRADLQLKPAWLFSEDTAFPELAAADMGVAMAATATAEEA